MSRHYKKALVRPEVAQKWLERHERDGESIPQIAKADEYDVRTVRRQLGLMQEAREAREARQTVLREALERHYADICAFAEKLRGEASGNIPAAISLALREDPIWGALRQHLPRSPLWKDLHNWDDKAAEFQIAIYKVKQHVIREAESRTSLRFVTQADTIGLIEGFTDGIVFHLLAVARGGRGLEGIENRRLKNRAGIRLQIGQFGLAVVPKVKVSKIEKAFDTIMAEALAWEEYSALREQSERFQKAKKAVHDEMTKIMLRRVVTGRCDYCPV